MAGVLGSPKHKATAVHYALCLFAVVCALGLSVAAHVKRQESQQMGFSMISTGAQLPSKLADNVPVLAFSPSVPPKKLVLYFAMASSRTLQTILYCQYIGTHYPSQRLSIALIVNPDAGSLIRYIHDLGDSAPPVYIDYQHKYSSLTKIPPTYNSTYLFDNHSNVLFSASTMALPDTIRQLYERYTAGSVQAAPSDFSERSLLGKRMANFPVINARTKQATTLNQLLRNDGPTTLFIFTARCAVCSLPHYLGSLVTKHDSSEITIFSTRTPVPVLKDVARTEGFTRPLYVASTQIPLVENLYYDTAISPYALSLVMDHSGTVESVIELTP